MAELHQKIVVAFNEFDESATQSIMNEYNAHLYKLNQEVNLQKENQIINQRFWSVITFTIIILLIVLILYLVKSRNIKQKELQFVQEQQEAKEERNHKSWVTLA